MESRLRRREAKPDPVSLIQTSEGRKMSIAYSDNYTRSWSPDGKIAFLTLSDGTRLRYLKTGTGPALVLLHTLRTQLDYFQRLIPKLTAHFTIYAVDLPGLGWSDIRPGASYDEPAVREAIVE